MEIKRFFIDNKFPSEIKKQIEILNINVEFSPVWQSIDWNLMLQKTNYIKKGLFIGVFENDNLINFVIIEKRDIGFKKYGNFIIGGPNSNILISNLENEIINFGKEEKVVFTQIESLEDSVLLNKFKAGTYKKFIEKCTAVINLTEGKESILAKMKQKGRYNIKVAEKNNVKVERVNNSSENLDKFYNLLIETKDRDEFNVNSKSYFNEFLNYLYTNNLGGLYFAEKDNILIAGGIFTDYKNTTYYYYGVSTSDNEKRKYMATYLLQWKVIEESIEKGQKNFDFLGINCPGCNSLKLAGVTDFKLKLTPEIKIWPDAKIYIHDKNFYQLLKLKMIVKKLITK